VERHRKGTEHGEWTGTGERVDTSEGQWVGEQEHGRRSQQPQQSDGLESALPPCSVFLRFLIYVKVVERSYYSIFPSVRNVPKLRR